MWNRSIARACAVLAGIAAVSAALAVELPISRLNPADRALWMISPPEPVQSDAQRVAELAARREAVLKAMAPGDVLILFAAQARVFSNDVNYPYRQENNFYYLTGINQEPQAGEDAGVLVMARGASPETVLFLPPPQPAQESWTGHMLSAAEAAAWSGIAGVRPLDAFDAALDALIPGAGVAWRSASASGRGGRRAISSSRSPAPAAIKGRLYLLTGDARNYPEEAAFAAMLATTAPAVATASATTLLNPLRNIKSPWELELLTHAVDISLEAHTRAMALTQPGVWEYQLRAVFDSVFGMRHADGWGYPEIVASGVNPTTLHYESDQEQVPAQGLMLIDAAAMYQHYSADVTRTYPISGHFTAEQAAIYNIVYDAQQAMIDAIRPNAGSPANLGNAALIAGLTKLGLITNAAGAPSSQQQLAIWYFHGPSHPIGLDVHDVGGGTYNAGMVLTEEPGLYFRPRTFEEDLPANDSAAWQVFTANVRPVFEHYKGIGVRIEDDIEVTPTGHTILSGALPRRLADVEAKYAALHAWVKANGGPPSFLPLQ